ncbi:hypothetical protein D3C71_1930100 [compost metagenome]
MGVEVDQRQRTMFTGVSLEQRIRDEVITAEGQHRAAGTEDVFGVGLYGFRGRLR